MKDQEPQRCQYEVSAFRDCKRVATERIIRQGCFCKWHSRKVITEMLALKIPYEVEKLKRF